MADKKQSNSTLVEEISNVKEEVFTDSQLNEIKILAENGAMYGHKKTRTNPRFKQFIFTTRNGIEIIDLGKTLKAIDEAAEFLKKQIAEGKTVLFVGLQSSTWEALDTFAKKYNFPKVKNRWVGGLITNFKNISGRIEYYKKTKSDLEKGLLSKYTKKEQVVISKELEKMGVMLEGFDSLTKIPDALFVVDTSLKGHMSAIKEAKIANIPVVAIIDSDDNPDLVDYAIPANDHSKASIELVVNKIIEKLG